MLVFNYRLTINTSVCVFLHYLRKNCGILITSKREKHQNLPHLGTLKSRS